MVSEQHAHRRVLIVDESDESREVLRTILERRGVEIVEASEAALGLNLVDQLHPDLIVLDLETLPASQDALRDRFNEQAVSSNTPMVLLGTARPATTREGSHRTLAKPYHYAPLIRTIEDLLRQSKQEPSA